MSSDRTNLEAVRGFWTRNLNGMKFLEAYPDSASAFRDASKHRYPFDGSKDDPCPVESTYSRSEIREMFRSYASCDVSIDYLFGTGYGTVNRMVPTAIHRALGRVAGWHLMIEATK